MTIRCALFVDFDNVLLSLQTSSKAAARTFATSPGTWTRWFERGGHDSSEHPEARRILLRRSYLNPERFGAYRKFFTYGGFQTVDCPSLTGMGKNSADIHMVLDIMEALEHPTRFDEFIVLSADADFTPVLLKLREHDRLTGVLSTALTSGALRSAATNAFDLDGFIEHALEIGDDPEEAEAEGSPLLRGNGHRLDRMTGQPLDLARTARRLAERLREEGAVPLDQVPRLLLMDNPAFRSSDWLGFGTLHAMVDGLIREDAGLSREARRPGGPHLTASAPLDQSTPEGGAPPASAEAVLDFLESHLARSKVPLKGAPAGQQVIERFGPAIKEGKWFGAGSLMKLVAKAERPGLAATGISGGLIYDPSRHDPEADRRSTPVTLPEPGGDASHELGPFLARLSTVGWPSLTPGQIALVITEAARLIGDGVPERNPLSARIRDACAAAASRGEIPEHKVSRASINVLLTGALGSGAVFGVNCSTEDEVRTHLRKALKYVVENRLGAPSEGEKEMIDRLLGFSPSGPDVPSQAGSIPAVMDLTLAPVDLAEDEDLLVDGL